MSRVRRRRPTSASSTRWSRGILLKLWMFVMRLSCSGRAFHVAFATQAQEAFLEGHVLAFDYFGAVPGRVRYDNLGPAVVRVLRGRDRSESERFIALRSHYKSVSAGSLSRLVPVLLLAAG